MITTPTEENIHSATDPNRCREMELDTPLPKGERILGSTSPLKLNALQCLDQRWFSPQAFCSISEACFGMPYRTVQT